MSATCIELFPTKTRSRQCQGRKYGGTLHPYGPWLCQGEEVSVYYTRLKPNAWPEHRHRHAELLLTFEAAQGEINWRNRAGLVKPQALAAHQFCLIPPNVPHACEWRREADVVVVYFGAGLLQAQVRQPLGGVLVGDFRPLTLLDECLWSLGAIFHSLCHTKERPAASFIEGVGTALASRTLELHFRARAQRARANPVLPEAALHGVLGYIDQHLREPISVADLARHAALSVDHFARLLKNTTGASPLQFLLKRRVEKALELLRTGKFRVGEVACEVGFCDQSHLDRHCRKFFGCLPKTALKTRNCS